jgi:Domain of unknown function (DUF4394)
MKQKPSLMLIRIVLSILILSTSCDENDDPAVIIKPDLIFYGLTEANQVIQYNANAPESPISTLNVTGLQSGETLMAIDFRPATGQLYGVGSASRIYTINLASGLATAIGANPFTPAITGGIVGFDFNPIVDRIRLVTGTGQNIRLHPETGAAAAVDTDLNPGNPGVNAVAYANSFAGASSTTLFDIDIASQKLFMQDPPNDGKLVEVGPLGITPTDDGGFDISPDNSFVLASLTVNGMNGLYQVDLDKGNATYLGNFSEGIVGLAIPTNPVAYSVDASNNLIIFDFTKSNAYVSKSITGLQMSETILGIDMRPLTGQLYALGSSSRLYTINMATGAATAVGTGPFDPILKGNYFGFDFNPTVDRIRIVSDIGQNLRANPITGMIAAIDSDLNPGTPVVSAAAYASNFAGTSTTILYDIDPSTDKLYRQTPPNEGKLEEIGPLNIDIGANNGFDIGGQSNKAYGLFTVGSTTKLYLINLANGTLTPIADGPAGINGLAVGLGF